MRFYILSVIAFLSLGTFVVADFGPCRFKDERCSCKVGSANQGTCWDQLAGVPGRCSKRFCKAGWTCACGGRTHVCYIGNKNVNVLKNDADTSQSTADCETAPVSMVTSLEISLGTFKIHISRPGIEANDCTQIVWWHNGVLLGIHNSSTDPLAATVDTKLAAREDHALLELRPGDLLAFRFKEGSYYCYKHLSDMLVNGTEITTSMAVTTTHYAREYSQNWFLPSFQLTAENTAADETETDLKKFLPLRQTKLTTGEEIIDGTDYWQSRDDTNADNKRSNWYYRIQIAGTFTSATI